MKCNFCQNSSTEHIYDPIDTGINLKIYVCKSCGLVQSKYDKISYENSNIPSKTKFEKLSCDAKYSEVRVGKQQMLKHFENTINQVNLKFKKSPKILDMKSARGDFALFAINYFKLQNIDCIEEDEYITIKYRQNKRIRIFKNKYHLFNEKGYDLIYSCHTLEHYQDPKKYLKWVRNHLKDGGYFYIDVPNLENINHKHNIDEFFYDKHLFYYDFETLKNFILGLGFKLVNKNISPQNIGILFKKSELNKILISNQYIYNKQLILNYKENIQINRIKIQSIGKELNKLFNNKGVNVVFGCGRPLDAFIKYGQLDLDNFQFLVDNFLSRITDKLYNKTLKNDKDLKKLDKVLMLIKHPSEELISKLPGNPEVILLNELLK